MREETPISVKKIWVNVKKFWWVCALTMAATVGLVAVSTWKEYQRDRIAAQRDTYQADSMIFFPVAVKRLPALRRQLCIDLRDNLLAI